MPRQYRADSRKRPDLIAQAEERAARFTERKLTAEELSDGIDAYFADCEAQGRKPIKPGLCTFLGISASTWDNWLREGDGKEPNRASNKREKEGVGRYSEYAWPMKKALQRIADGLEQRTDTMALFLLKQSCYGGYSDKGEGGTASSMAISITFGETHKNTARGYGK